MHGLRPASKQFSRTPSFGLPDVAQRYLGRNNRRETSQNTIRAWSLTPRCWPEWRSARAGNTCVIDRQNLTGGGCISLVSSTMKPVASINPQLFLAVYVHVRSSVCLRRQAYT